MIGPDADDADWATKASTPEIVLDASVAIKWFVPEDFSSDALRFSSPRFAIHVPGFFAAECGNTIWKKVFQRHQLNEATGREILECLLSKPMQIHAIEDFTTMTFDIALEVGRSSLALYDFFYLALAIILDCRLVTADRPFFNAIRATRFAAYIIWVTDSSGELSEEQS